MCRAGGQVSHHFGLEQQSRRTLSKPIVSQSLSEDPFSFRTVIRAASERMDENGKIAAGALGEST